MVTKRDNVVGQRVSAPAHGHNPLEIMTSQLYEIRDYAYEPGWVHYVTETTTSIADAWTTALPLDSEEIQKFSTATPPKKFETKSEAKPYLDALKATRLENWAKDGYLDKARGCCRPAWKIYAAEAN